MVITVHEEQVHEKDEKKSRTESAADVLGGGNTPMLHEDLPGCPAWKSGEEWQLVAKRR